MEFAETVHICPLESFGFPVTFADQLQHVLPGAVKVPAAFQVVRQIPREERILLPVREILLQKIKTAVDDGKLDIFLSGLIVPQQLTESKLNMPHSYQFHRIPVHCIQSGVLQALFQEQDSFQKVQLFTGKAAQEASVSPVEILRPGDDADA